MAAVWRFVEVWWWLFLLVLAQGIVRMVIVQAAFAARRVLDRRIPDDLPESAGEWVGGQLRRLGLAGEIAVSPVPHQGGGDAYFPGARLIGLGTDTYFKHDPTFWAIGAHELGHALTYRWRALAVVFVAARVWAAGCIGLGTSLILANVLYGSPEVSQLARTAWLAGIGGGVIVVLDETVASVRAWGLLRADGSLGRAHMRAAAASLLSAWSSYAAALAAQTVVVAYYDRIAAHIEAHHVTFETGEPLGTAGGAFAAVLTGMLIIYAAALLRRVVQPRDHDGIIEAKHGAAMESAADGCCELAVCALLVMVWDLPEPSGAFVVAVALAAYAARSALSVVLLPLSVLLALVTVGVVALGPVWLLDRLTAGPKDAAEPAKPTPQQERDAEAALERAEALLIKQTIEVHNGRPWHARLGRLTRLTWAPLVAVLWLQ